MLASDPDAVYRDLLIDPLRKCADYKPNLGKRDEKYDLAAFRVLYGRDPLYHWIGLDSDLMYAAHKAAGGMTSIYRQLGIGCERLVRQILRDVLRLTAEQVTWSYEVVTESTAGNTDSDEIEGELTEEPTNDVLFAVENKGAANDRRKVKPRKLSLDGRIDLADVSDLEARNRIKSWITEQQQRLGITVPIKGAVFEVRQGYKSADSKRQNADLANASQAIGKGYLPVLMIMSTQMNEVVKARYEVGNWAVLMGLVGLDDPYTSTFDFCRDAIGYDLELFFVRNQHILRNEVENILKGLLTAA